jgi:excisionase family DNA binding protein
VSEGAQLIWAPGEVQMDRIVLKPKEAASLLGVGRSTMYALLAAGVIPSIRIGHAVRVPVDQLQQWLRRQSETSTARDEG